MAARILKYLSAVGLILLADLPTLSAQSDEGRSVPIGLGIVLIDTPAPYTEGQYTRIGQPVRILVPIRATSRLVVEPELRFLHRTFRKDYWEVEGRWLGAGVGLLWSRHPEQSLSLYYGLRLAVSIVDADWIVEGEGAAPGVPDIDARCRNSSGAVCVGGHYRLSSHLTLGAEARVRHTVGRDREYAGPWWRHTDTSTGVLGFVRIHP